MNAVDASVCVAKEFGLRVQEPVLLRSTNNVVAWLRPSAGVAKIGVGAQRGFDREISVASELSALGGPVVAPASEVPAVVHRHDGFTITFWRYYPQPSDVDIQGEQVAAALHHLHATCARLSSELRARLPLYVAELQSVSELLADAGQLPALPAEDRHLLIRVFDHLWKRLHVDSHADTPVVIHGAPHPYNVLLVEGQPRFIDFETTCIGPVEWDLAHTSPETAHAYAGDVDRQLLKTCRDLVRVKTAAWCWAGVDRGDLRYHAETHLAYLKEMFALGARKNHLSRIPSP
jgi:Phosphotransferase enzyme family